MAASSPRSTTRTIDGHDVTLSSLDKVMYPDTGMTKQGVIDYYTVVSDALLPQLKDRVVTRIRYIDGVGGDRFYEKNTPTYMPEWIRRFSVSASPGTGVKAKQVRYPVIDDVAGLVWMANQAALELHTPQWRIGPRGGVRNPDRLVIDLDPGEGIGLDDVAEIAVLMKKRLAKDGLEPIPVTSGSKGIHLYAAVDGKRTALKVHDYVMTIAREMAETHPDRIVAVADKAERIGKVMIDWSQNHPARSTATPYTLRGKSAPTVAAPRTWEEIGPGLAQLGPDEVLKRLDDLGDLMERAGLT
jgi:bifunctional non-homologous end joining protein LigD